MTDSIILVQASDPFSTWDVDGFDSANHHKPPPVPEPAFYGFLMVVCAILLMLVARWKKRKQGATS